MHRSYVRNTRKVPGDGQVAYDDSIEKLQHALEVTSPRETTTDQLKDILRKQKAVKRKSSTQAGLNQNRFSTQITTVLGPRLLLDRVRCKV